MGHTNHDVAHLWANQSKSRARSSNGNFSFSGDTIYSYSTPIARLILDPETGKPKACLRTSERFSVTTSSKHESAISSALRGDLPVIHVPHLWSYSGRPDHDHNLGYFEKQITATAAKARRSLQYAEWTWESVVRLVDQGNEYIRLFNCDHPRFQIPADWHESLAKSRERVRRIENPDPESLDKRERERARRFEKKRLAEQERERQFQARLAEQIAEWRDGRGPSYLPWGAPMMLRLQPGHPDTLETSKGAHVPVADAVKVFRMAELARDTGSALDLSGYSTTSRRIGDFHLDAIDQDGTIHAGCHTIPWAESERMAQTLGLLEETTHA